MSTTPDLSSMNTDELLALQVALQARLTEVRENLKVQAEALGMSCAADNAAHKKKSRRPNAKNDVA